MLLLVAVAIVAVALPLLTREYGDPIEDRVPTLRPTPPPAVVHSMSIDFGIVTDPATDWGRIAGELDAAGGTTVNLNAGRVEWTAFDWPAHPEAAADPGTNHLAVAARGLDTRSDGQPWQVNLIVDSYVPEWIKADPDVAGVNARGRRSKYTASVAQLDHGEVGDRLIEYVAALGEHFDPNQIEVTELFLDDYTFGEDDLELYRQQTGASDWPRTADGDIDTEAPEIGVWRSEALAGLMGRMRAALDQVRGGEGADIGLVLDVRVDWSDPAAGRPMSGHDYEILLRERIKLQLWVYPGRANRDPEDVEPLTAALRAGGYDMSRFIVSVGLWKGDTSARPPGRLSPPELATAVAGAGTNGIIAVNVTPYSLMTPGLWGALRQAWVV